MTQLVGDMRSSASRSAPIRHVDPVFRTCSLSSQTGRAGPRSAGLGRPRARSISRGLHMDEQALRGLIADVKRGKLSRRAFINRMIAVGLTAPFAAQMLTYSGVARAQTRPDYKPTKRGGGGPLRVLWCQGAPLLNPHFAVGTKDQDGSRLFYEPLASWDPAGFLYPVLAAEIPDLEKNGLAKDGKSVTWKLKPGVQWH